MTDKIGKSAPSNVSRLGAILYDKTTINERVEKVTHFGKTIDGELPPRIVLHIDVGPFVRRVFVRLDVF